MEIEENNNKGLIDQTNPRLKGKKNPNIILISKIYQYIPYSQLL